MAAELNTLRPGISLFSREGWSQIKKTFSSIDEIKDTWGGAGIEKEAVTSGRLLFAAGAIDCAQNVYRGVTSGNPFKFLWHILKPDNLLNILGILCLVPGFQWLMIPVAIGYLARAVWDIASGNYLSGIMTAACALPVGQIFKNFGLLTERALKLVPANVTKGLKPLLERLTKQITKVTKVQDKLIKELETTTTSIVSEAEKAGVVAKESKEAKVLLSASNPSQFRSEVVKATETKLEEEIAGAGAKKLADPETIKAIQAEADKASKAVIDKAIKDATDKAAKDISETAKQALIDQAKKDAEKAAQEAAIKAEEAAKKRFIESAEKAARQKLDAFKNLIRRKQELEGSIISTQEKIKTLESSKGQVTELLNDGSIAKLEGEELKTALESRGIVLQELKFDKKVFLDETLNVSYGKQAKEDFYGMWNDHFRPLWGDIRNSGGVGQACRNIFYRVKDGLTGKVSYRLGEIVTTEGRYFVTSESRVIARRATEHDLDIVTQSIAHPTQTFSTDTFQALQSMETSSSVTLPKAMRSSSVVTTSDIRTVSKRTVKLIPPPQATTNLPPVPVGSA